MDQAYSFSSYTTGGHKHEGIFRESSLRGSGQMWYCAGVRVGVSESVSDLRDMFISVMTLSGD